MSQLILSTQSTAPSAPSTGKVSVYVDGNGDLSWKDAGGLITKIAAAGSYTLTLSNSGTLDLAGFTLTVPATGTAALYSTGTWTPALQFGGATTGITYTSRVGTYTKIGDVCFINGAFLLSSKGSASGAAAVAGLPFTVRNTAGQYAPLTVQWLNMAVNYVHLHGLFFINTTTFTVNAITIAAASVPQIADTGFGNTTELRFNGFYFV